MKQNITPSLDKEIIQQAKILAAQHSTSINALLTEKLTQVVGQDRRYQQAKRQALHELEQGLELGGQYFDRENLYHRQSGRCQNFTQRRSERRTID